MRPRPVGSDHSIGLWSQSHTAQHTREEYGRKRAAKLETADIASALPPCPRVTPSPSTGSTPGCRVDPPLGQCWYSDSISSHPRAAAAHSYGRKLKALSFHKMRICYRWFLLLVLIRCVDQCSYDDHITRFEFNWTDSLWENCLKYVSIKVSKFKILLSTWPAFSQEGPNCVSSH